MFSQPKTGGKSRRNNLQEGPETGKGQCFESLKGQVTRVKWGAGRWGRREGEATQARAVMQAPQAMCGEVCIYPRVIGQWGPRSAFLPEGYRFLTYKKCSFSVREERPGKEGPWLSLVTSLFLSWFFGSQKPKGVNLCPH